MSVVIPAHDEAFTLHRLLTRLVTSPHLEIVVVANGCTDDTAHVARSFGSPVRVVEITEASKTAALNAGDDTASVFPRAYVDADVDVAASTLLELGDLLGDASCLVAAPPLRVDTSAASWPVRQHYKIWALSDYRVTGHIGSGIYAVSAAGRERWGAFPSVIADDRFVQQQFAPHERGMLDAPHAFTVAAPRTFRSHLRRATRIEAGNAQLSDSAQPAGSTAASSRYGSLVRRVLRRPMLWPAFPVYCVGYLVPRLRARRAVARGRVIAWNRDEASRVRRPA